MADGIFHQWLDEQTGDQSIFHVWRDSHLDFQGIAEADLLYGQIVVEEGQFFGKRYLVNSL
jgi:hypothetical protein